MKTIIYNDAEASRLREELEKQQQPNIDDVFSSTPITDLVSMIRRDYVECGEITINEKGFGFVCDIFISPKLAEKFSQGQLIVVLWEIGPRGSRAVKAVDAEKYVSWHESEIKYALSVRETESNRRHTAYLEDKIQYWERLKERTLQTGHRLIEFTSTITRSSYGGAGVNTLVIDDTCTQSEARTVFQALGLTHESLEQGSFDHGHDVITVVGNTLKNSWCGPWTD